MRTAHPRSRGENRSRTLSPIRGVGSSPLTRGKLARCDSHVPGRGLIPAHAGKTSAPPNTRRPRAAHPRSRGENPPVGRHPGVLEGSSPLTRGKHACRDCSLVGLRLIPAHAGKTMSVSFRVSEEAAHPRSRGENLIGAVRTLVVTGSSPLTRGKPRRRPNRCQEARLIPAHAGKTCCDTRGSAHSWAHPRSRGENRRSSLASSRAAGSSPLTRGKRRPECLRARLDGLIPAHAGKTGTGVGRRGTGQAHPRSRGENHPTRPVPGRYHGSSPLTRGKLAAVNPTFATVRLIPAHAGKTPPRSGWRQTRAAHPRSRGENSRPRGRASRRAGSSPLTRGKHPPRSRQKPTRRLIPAHAGKTELVHRCLSCGRAHPRSRGENSSRVITSPIVRGSSPLTRGKRIAKIAKCALRRLIPAHAGKTASSSRTCHALAAHPRSRGENTRAGCASATSRGSSPLTRGKRVCPEARLVETRLIPAHAGKTSTRWCAHRAEGAHPRSRGENGARVAGLRGLRGSSPLTRGKRRNLHAQKCTDRLIPAHAGKTC